MTVHAKCLEHEADLSIYAHRSQILYVCAEGHWWTVAATEVGSTTPDATARAASGRKLDVSVPGDRSLLHLQEQFGPEVLESFTVG